jgi:type IV pilus assembly protein PilC
MAVFQYEALDSGARRQGAVTAPSAAEAGAVLRRQDLVIVRLEEVADAGDDHERVERSALERRLAGAMTRPVRVEQALRQLGALLQAGVPILNALHVVAEQAPYFLSRAIRALARKVRGGTPLSRSIEEEAPFISGVARGLMAAGEANGTLDEMCHYAADLAEKRRHVKGQILQAFAYPVVVICVTAGVVAFLITKVIPKFMAFISQRSGELPWATQALVDVVHFIQAWGVHCIVVPVGLLVLAHLARRHPQLGPWIDHAILRIPLIGKAFIASANAMWCRTLGMLLHSGIDIITAISLTQGTVGNRHYAAQFARLKGIVQHGQALSAGMLATALARLCPMAQAMTSVGEGTGAIDEGLARVAEFSEDQLNRRVAFLARLIEPVLFLVVGGIVAFVYFAFFLALLAATRSVGK